MCDNCRHPKEKIEVQTEMQNGLLAIEKLNENYGIKNLVEFVIGKETKEMADFKHDHLIFLGLEKTKMKISGNLSSGRHCSMIWFTKTLKITVC